MPAIPWKMRQRRSTNDRLDHLSVENRRLRKEVNRIHLDTLRKICRRIETGEGLTLHDLKAELVRQINRIEEDSHESLTFGKNLSFRDVQIG